METHIFEEGEAKGILGKYMWIFLKMTLASHGSFFKMTLDTPLMKIKLPCKTYIFVEGNNNLFMLGLKKKNKTKKQMFVCSFQTDPKHPKIRVSFFLFFLF